MLNKLINGFYAFDNYMARKLGEQLWDVVMITLFCLAGLGCIYIVFQILQILLLGNDILALAIMGGAFVWYGAVVIKRM